MNELAEIKESLKRIEQKLDNHLERISKVEVRVESGSTQLKILWGIVTTVFGGLLSIIFINRSL